MRLVAWSQLHSPNFAPCVQVCGPVLPMSDSQQGQPSVNPALREAETELCLDAREKRIAEALSLETQEELVFAAHALEEYLETLSSIQAGLNQLDEFPDERVDSSLN